jgi:hypothetical protein
MSDMGEGKGWVRRVSREGRPGAPASSRARASLRRARRRGGPPNSRRRRTRCGARRRVRPRESGAARSLRRRGGPGREPGWISSQPALLCCSRKGRRPARRSLPVNGGRTEHAICGSCDGASVASGAAARHGGLRTEKDLPHLGRRGRGEACRHFSAPLRTIADVVTFLRRPARYNAK